MQIPVTIRKGSSPGRLLRTGDHCTETGWWSPLERGAPRFLKQGSLMPSVEGEPALWGPRDEAHCSASCPSHTCPRG
jgi:hypothetical protein